MENSKKHKDYKQGKIYCIRNTITDDVYIGATCQPLSKRMAEHRKHMNSKKAQNYKLYRKMRELGHQSFYIELIEEVKCDNIEQLRKREGELIRQMGTLNARIECRSVKEWRQDNKQKITNDRHQYYEDNKEHILEQNRQYRDEHKEERTQFMTKYNKQYYQTKREELLLKLKQPFECECGSIIQKGQKSRHLKSKKTSRIH